MSLSKLKRKCSCFITGQFISWRILRQHLKRTHPHLEAKKTNSIQFTAKLHFSFQPHTSHWLRCSNRNRLTNPSICQAAEVLQRQMNLRTEVSGAMQQWEKGCQTCNREITQLTVGSPLNTTFKLFSSNLTLCSGMPSVILINTRESHCCLFF